MVVMIVLGAVVWLSIPPLLCRAMSRRGYDGGSWLVVGLLFGPVGVALATMEVLSDVPQESRILEARLTGEGEVSILVVLAADSPTHAGLRAWSARRDSLVPGEHRAPHGDPHPIG
jgi:hypothetical protein